MSNYRPLIALALASVLLSACASVLPTKKPKTLQVVIEPGQTLNTDARGTPRPVTIKVFQLKDKGLFTTGSFTDLFTDSDSYLGDDLVAVKDHQLLPAKALTLTLPVDKRVRYIAVVAAFMDQQDSDWKAIRPLPKRCLHCIKGLIKPKPLRLWVDGSKITFNQP